MMTEQDIMMWLVSRDPQRSPLGCVTCWKTLHGHVDKLFQKFGKILDSLLILNQIYYSLGYSQSIRFRHQVKSFMGVHYKFTPECKHLLCLNYFTYTLSMCTCVEVYVSLPKITFHSQSGNNSQERKKKKQIYVISDVKIYYSLTHMKYVSSTDLHIIAISL